ncbi:MAG: oligosaccharide flippase family protein, partial [Muribaculaceae bacterium]|nr:oligosaccharide flippase family protein [Muribaculaceae bacterium]
ALLSGLVGVGLALLGWGVWAIVWQTIVCALLNVILSFYYVKWYPHARFSSDSFHRLFSFGSKLLVANIISAVYAKIYDVVIGKKFSAAQLGLYSRADKFNQFASSNISGILQRVSFPILSEIQDDDSRLLGAYRKYLQMSALVVFPIIMGLCGVARPLIELLLGAEWMDCVPLLQILSFAYLWDCVVIVNLNLIYVKGHSDYVLRLEVVKKSVAFVILLATLPFGLVTICLGRVVYAIISFYLNTYYTRKLLDYGFFTQLRELAPLIFLSVAIAALGWLISWMVQNAWLSLCLSLIVCPLFYVSACWLLRLPVFGEFYQLACSYLKKK